VYEPFVANCKVTPLLSQKVVSERAAISAVGFELNLICTFSDSPVQPFSITFTE